MVEYISKSNDFKKKIEKATEDINGEVPITELFDAEFMEKYTTVATIEDLLEKTGYGNKKFEDITEDELNSVVKEHTSFETWGKMKSTAGQQYAAKIFKQHGFSIE